jgi:hypothetical protein
LFLVGCFWSVASGQLLLTYQPIAKVPHFGHRSGEPPAIVLAIQLLPLRSQ